MNTLKKSQAYHAWFAGLNDIRARRKILARVKLAEAGSFGDHHVVDGGVWEMRIDYGPGYRIYYAQEGTTIYLLLLGGDKDTQARDITKAKAVWQAAKGK